MLYQTFKQFPDGTTARFGRTTQNLRLAVERAAAVRGEVRPLGSLTPCWQGHVFTTGQPLKPAALKPAPVRLTSAPRFAGGSSAQSSVSRYHPDR